MDFQRTDFAPLRETGYGIGFHWTTWTLPQGGRPVKPFAQAVDDFDVDAFVAQAVEAGAGHVLWTANHALHRLPAPHPEVDRILPGRTCRRDLLGEIADGLAARGIKLILYYHHGTDGPQQDPEWQAAVGSLEADQAGFYDNYCRIVAGLGERYGPKITAFWFDAGYALVRRGPVPWERLAEAARAGHPGRLLTYNAGVECQDDHTPCQDYWAGEVCRLNFVPRGPQTRGGLPWYSFVSWHPDPRWPGTGEWGIGPASRDLDWPPPCVEGVVAYLRRFQALGGTVTFNLLCYQDGSAYPTDLETMKGVKRLLLSSPEPSRPT